MVMKGFFGLKEFWKLSVWAHCWQNIEGQRTKTYLFTISNSGERSIVLLNSGFPGEDYYPLPSICTQEETPVTTSILNSKRERTSKKSRWTILTLVLTCLMPQIDGVEKMIQMQLEPYGVNKGGIVCGYNPLLSCWVDTVKDIAMSNNCCIAMQRCLMGIIILSFNDFWYLSPIIHSPALSACCWTEGHRGQLEAFPAVTGRRQSRQFTTGATHISINKQLHIHTYRQFRFAN